MKIEVNANKPEMDKPLSIPEASQEEGSSINWRNKGVKKNPTFKSNAKNKRRC